MSGVLKEYIENQLSLQKDELKEFITEYVKEENIDIAISIHSRYILAIPESLSVFSNLVLDPTTRQEIRAYFSLVIAYILEPENYIRKYVPVTVDMLVNAYVLHASLEIALQIVSDEKIEELSDKLEFLKPIFELNPVIRDKIPEHILVKHDIIIHYLDKLLDVKAAMKKNPIYIMPSI